MKNLSEKTCTKCGGVFPATAEYFHRRKDSKDGLRNDCKKCHGKQTKQYREGHLEQAKQYNKQYRQTKTGKEKHAQDYWRHKKKRLEQHREYRETLNGYLRQVFKDMVHRCTNPKRHNYSRYGGRGIKCTFSSANSFIDYVVNALGISSFEQIRGLQIDRTDNDGHYEPGNIRFVTAKVNANNRRRQS